MSYLRGRYICWSGLVTRMALGYKCIIEGKANNTLLFLFNGVSVLPACTSVYFMRTWCLEARRAVGSPGSEFTEMIVKPP